jgi:hypothetical protein
MARNGALQRIPTLRVITHDGESYPVTELRVDDDELLLFIGQHEEAPGDVSSS